MLPVLLLLISTLCLVVCCPSKEQLYPCTCTSAGYSKYITCASIENDQELVNSVSALKGVEDIYSFVIKDAALNYIPHDLFKGVKLVELEFLTSSIMEFTDTDVAFEGLEDSLEIFLVTSCTFMNSWDWSLLKNMKKLTRLDIIEGDLEGIEDGVKDLSLDMEDINFSENKISYIYDYAFANFTKLKFLSLKNNLIEEVKKSMLPNPALQLMILDLGYNNILQLPLDFFENMPSLETLSIAYNKILTLNENVFTPVWPTVEDFQAMGNKLRCDCRMAWILERKMPRNMRAICDQPLNLRGKNLATLTTKDLWCWWSLWNMKK